MPSDREYVRRSAQLSLRFIPVDLFELLHRLLAGIHFGALVSARLREPNANAELVLSVDALAVICFQILVSYLTRKIPTFPAMTLGLVISSLAWLILAFFPPRWD